MNVHYFHEFTCVVEPIWEMTLTCITLSNNQMIGTTLNS